MTWYGITTTASESPCWALLIEIAGQKEKLYGKTEATQVVSSGVAVTA